MILAVVRGDVMLLSIPRESGDDPTLTGPGLRYLAYSPRERG